MKLSSVKKNKKGFTLIELLIVVAIIAILAAIAVPNFLEAQTRSKVSRLLADMRSMKTAIESYRVDTNKYPETDFGIESFTNGVPSAGAGLIRITTPISYMTTIPRSPFMELKLGGTAPLNAPSTDPADPDTRHCHAWNSVLWVRAAIPAPLTIGPYTVSDDDPGDDGIDDSYQKDRVTYLLGDASINAGNRGFSRQGFYMMKSVGPDNIDNRNADQVSPMAETDARIYDPTNGTVSYGDIVTFQDTSILAAGG